MSRKKDYEVGYGKPPKHTQFRPGQSGNPRGRPKGRKNPKTAFKELLEQPVTITIDGKRKRMSMLEALYNSLLSKALAGQPAAIRALLELVKANKYFDNGPPEGTYGVLKVREPCEDLDEWARRAQAHYDWARKRYGPQAQEDAPRQGKGVAKVKRVRQKKND